MTVTAMTLKTKTPKPLMSMPQRPNSKALS